MKLLLVFLAVSAVATAATFGGSATEDIDDPRYELDLMVDKDFWRFVRFLNGEDVVANESGERVPQPRFFPASSQMRKFVRNVQKDMPCGFPKYGIPPLAPYRQENVHAELLKDFLSEVVDLYRFQVAGLDDFIIKKLTINVITMKCKFHFVFKDIAFLAEKFDNRVLVDLMESLGIDAQYETAGGLDFRLQKVAVFGSFKIKIPILFGSIRIVNFICHVTLGNCQSNIGGLFGNGKLNRLLNNKIEELVEFTVQDKSELISAKIEELIVPPVNDALKGKKLADILEIIGGGAQNNEVMEMEPAMGLCVPPPDPWS